MGLSSLVKAVVGGNVKHTTTSFDDYVEMVQFLRQISHVKVLCFSGFLMMILEETCAKHPDAFSGLPTFQNLTHLEVEYVLSVSLVVPYILEWTPNLKVFVLEISDDSNHASPSSQKWNPPKSVPQCFSCLGMVEFRKFLASEIDRNSGVPFEECNGLDKDDSFLRFSFKGSSQPLRYPQEIFKSLRLVSDFSFLNIGA